MPGLEPAQLVLADPADDNLETIILLRKLDVATSKPSRSSKPITQFCWSAARKNLATPRLNSELFARFFAGLSPLLVSRYTTPVLSQHLDHSPRLA